VPLNERRDFASTKIEIDDNEWKGFGHQGHEVKEIFFFGIT
jgi:hypothetical protein